MLFPTIGTAIFKAVLQSRGVDSPAAVFRFGKIRIDGAPDISVQRNRPPALLSAFDATIVSALHISVAPVAPQGTYTYFPGWPTFSIGAMLVPAGMTTVLVLPFSANFNNA